MESTFASLVSGLSKSYLYTNLARDVVRFIRRNLSDVDFDADALLHRAGLSRYRPAATAGGGVMLMLAGAVVGAGAALLFAPSPGKQLRSQVKETAMGWLDQVSEEKSGKSERNMNRAATS